MRAHAGPPLLACLLMGTISGAQQYDLRVYGMEQGLPNSCVQAIAQDSSGYLWLETNAGLCRFDGRNFTPWSATDGPPPAEIDAIPNGRGSAWSLARPTLSERSSKLAAEYGGVTCDLIARPNQRYWVGHGTGLVAFDPPYTESSALELNGLNDVRMDSVRCLFQDKSGSLWIGTQQSGLFRFRSEAFCSFGDLSRVSDIAVAPDGSVWFCSGDGAVTCKRPKGPITVEDLGERLHSICVRPDGTVLLGADAGLLRMVPDGASGRNRTQGRKCHRSLSERSIHVIRPLPDDRIWLGTDRGILQLRSNRVERIGHDTLAVTTMVLAGDSMVIGTDRGLFAAAIHGAVEHWSPYAGTESEDIVCLTRDRAGNIWIGTREHGVLRLNADGMQRWTSQDKLASDHVKLLQLDAFDNLWVGTDRGFNLMELDELQEKVINITYYGVEDGFPGIEATYNASLLDPDSSLWLGTTRGTIRFDPSLIIEDPVPPRMQINELLILFEHPDLSKWSDGVEPNGLPIGLKLPYNKNHLTFLYTGLSLAYPERVRYRYILEGYDPDWSPITETDRVTYSNVPPGDYIFKVTARNASGIWTEQPVSYTFTIDPPIWQTTSFKIGGASVLALGLFGFIRVRERRSRLDRERLERTVKERTHELGAEKDRSDELLRNILPASTAEELKQRGTAAAKRYEHCTVLFSDFKGFSTFSSRMDSETLVAELDHFFRTFDRLCDRFGMEKIKTIGDAYMCASGIPEPRATHAIDAVRMGMAMLDEVAKSNAERRSKGLQEWPVRIGLHSGPVVAGVVGEKKFAYDIWGDTVNVASRMESNGEAGQLNISGPTFAQVMDRVEAIPRGPIKIKGKGQVQMYFVQRLKDTATPERA